MLALNSIDAEISEHKGFIYIYKCDSLDCYKVGRTKENPLDYMKSKELNYGLKFSLVSYISSPIKDSDAEWIITNRLQKYIVDHTKPCGGKAIELFACDIFTLIKAFSIVSNNFYTTPI